jgi:undecaprenyl-diphosphatase
MTILYSIILGIVEGISEFLPISSTGHMVLVSGLLRIAEDPFTKNFEIIIQLGAILSVVFIYWNRLIKNRHLSIKVFTAFLPTAVIGLLLHKYVKELLGSVYVVITCLFIGGIVLMYFEKWVELYLKKKGTVRIENPENISTVQALYVGVFQSIAIIPGVSRSAATIIGGEFLGISRKAIVEFSFLLAIPTMFAATALSLFDLWKTKTLFTSDQVTLLLVGLIVSFVVALLAVKTFLRYIEKHSFRPFGIYRICLAIVYLVYILSVVR